MRLRTAEEAVATALAEAQDPSEDYHVRCDHFVGVCYGLAHSGYASALEHWRAIPDSHKHSGPPPAGGVAYWDIGKFGHTAIVVAPGTIASNDILVKGRVSVVRLGRIEESWRRSRYLGWADPYFHGSWIDLGGRPRASAAPAPQGTVSLASVQAAAITDPPAPQGHLTDMAGTLLVERALEAEGLLDAKFVDGSFGRRTVDAYAAWQRSLSFSGTSADGIPGIKTLTALGFRHGFTVVR